MSIFSGKIQAFIFLVFPIILFGIFIINVTVINFLSVSHLFTLSFILFVIIIPISLLYSIYPALIKSEKFFIKRGYVNITLEFEFIKKFLLIIVVIITISNVYYIFEPVNPITIESRDITNSKTNLEKQDSNLTKDRSGHSLFSLPEPFSPAEAPPPSRLGRPDVFEQYRQAEDGFLIKMAPIFPIQSFLGLIAFAAFLRIITQLVKKEFRLYYTKGCCKLISEKKDKNLIKSNSYL